MEDKPDTYFKIIRLYVFMNKSRTRLVIAFGLVCLLMTFLCCRALWWQVVKADELSDSAKAQQTKDDIVESERGTIYDRNGQELAMSGVSYSIWVRPALVTSGKEGDDKNKQIENTVEYLSDILDMKKSDVKECITSDQTLVKLAKGITKKKADKIEELMESTEEREFVLSGIEITENARRYYPLGSFLSSALGCVNDEGTGIAGVEQYYNSVLTGINGRWTRNTDRDGNRVSLGKDKYYEPEPGSSIETTIDSSVQKFVETAIKSTKKSTKAKRVMAVVMEVETGDILAMAVTPSYNPNKWSSPLSEDEEDFEEMSSEEQSEYLNEMWRNPLVSDVYEPGSTFKLITSAIALEEGVVDMNDTFTCSGSMDISGTIIKCWRSENPHGTQTLKEAVGNSCNPALMQVGAKIGIDTFYEYLDLFGITSTTGIDLPSEGTSILQDKESAGDVGLATISFGQGIALTPIQLITAVSAIGNDGKMMKPHILKSIKDSNGKTTYEYEPEIVRQIISRKTSKTVCEIMEYAVTDGGVGAAAVDGYRIGGKTGTAYKAVNGSYSKNTDSSFIGLAPIDDPKYAVLVIVDSPKGEKYGSVTAAPCGQKIFKKLLPYMGIESSESTSEDEKVKVPDITGENYSDAVGILAGKGLKYKVKDKSTKKDFVVKDQYPEAGAKVEKDSTVYIYGE